jgi:hypothetical protein
MGRDLRIIGSSGGNASQTVAVEKDERMSKKSEKKLEKKKTVQFVEIGLFLMRLARHFS